MYLKVNVHLFLSSSRQHPHLKSHWALMSWIHPNNQNMSSSPVCVDRQALVFHSVLLLWTHPGYYWTSCCTRSYGQLNVPVFSFLYPSINILLFTPRKTRLINLLLNLQRPFLHHKNIFQCTTANCQINTSSGPIQTEASNTLVEGNLHLLEYFLLE